MKRARNVVATDFCISCLLCLSALGQAVGPSTPPPTGFGHAYSITSKTNALSIRAIADYSYVAPGDVSFQGTKTRSDANAFSVGLSTEIPVAEKWFVPAELGSRNLLLGTVEGAPIPDRVHTLGFQTGAGYRLDDRWTFLGTIGPRLYRLDNIGGDDIGVAGVVRAVYKWRPDFTLGFGIAFEPDNQIPVLPLAGFRWDIETNLTLNFMWPGPALIYRLDARTTVFLRAGGNFMVFRGDSNLGSKINQPMFNNALGTYRDFHLGPGAEYRLLSGVSVGLQSGYSVGRQINYTRLDQTVSFKPSPFVTLDLVCRF